MRRILFNVAVLIKTVLMGAMAVYFTASAVLIGARTVFAQAPSTYELQQQVEHIQLDTEKRLVVLETVGIQTTERLSSIEGMLWKMLLGIAGLVGETVWQYVIRVKVRTT